MKLFQRDWFPWKSPKLLTIGANCMLTPSLQHKKLFSHHNIKKGGNQCICFYDVEKALIPKTIIEISVNGRLWHLLKS